MSKWRHISTLNSMWGSRCVGIARQGEYARIAYINHPVFTFCNPVEAPPTHWLDLATVDPLDWENLAEEITR